MSNELEYYGTIGNDGDCEVDITFTMGNYNNIQLDIFSMGKYQVNDLNFDFTIERVKEIIAEIQQFISENVEE